MLSVYNKIVNAFVREIQKAPWLPAPYTPSSSSYASQSPFVIVKPPTESAFRSTHPVVGWGRFGETGINKLS